MPALFRSLILGGLLLTTPAAADDISDAITRAQDAYAAQDFGTARVSLGEASQLLNQKLLESLVAVFPEKLEGWSFEKDQDTSSAGGAYGTGNQISRNYMNDKNQSLNVQVMSDSPVIPQMAMIYANPQMAGAMGKLIYIGKQRGLQDTAGTITLLVNNRFLIQASGDASAEDKVKAMQALNFKALEEL